MRKIFFAIVRRCVFFRQRFITEVEGGHICEQLRLQVLQVPHEGQFAFHRAFDQVPGMSSRLISFVPSKIRLMRESR